MTTDYLAIAKQAMRERERQRLTEHASKLKGHAVELWRSNDRYFIVADEADARAVVERGWGSRGEVWTQAEVEVVARIADQGMRDEIERWKRTCNATVRPA